MAIRYSGCLLYVFIFSILHCNVIVQGRDITPDNTIELGDESCRMVLSSTGRVLEIKDLVNDTVLVKNSKDVPAWIIQLRDNKKIITSDQYSFPSVVRIDKGAVFKWQGRSLPTLIGKVTYCGEDKSFKFSFQVKNNIRGKRVLQSIAFPGGLCFPAEAGNYMVCSNNNKYTGPIHYLDSLQSMSIMYPGFMQMQMMGFKVGKSSLLTYTNDTKGHVKFFAVEKRKGDVLAKISQLVKLKPGGKRQLPYSLVLKIVPGGTYQELAQEYGKWGRQQWWAKLKFVDKVKRTPLLENYCKYGCARIHTFVKYIQPGKDRPWKPDGEYSNQYTKEVIHQAKLYEDEYGIKPGYWYPSWSGNKFDSMYPDYFPVKKWMGDFKEFREKLIETRRPMMYHLNMAHWAKTSPSYDKKLMAIWKGNVYEGRWANLPHVYTSLALTLKREMQTIDRIKDSAGVNGVYLDVLGHCFAIDDNPLSRYSKYPNGYQLAKQNTFKTIRETLTGPMMTEGRNEIFLPWVDFGFGVSGNPNDDHVPLWELVYGDCVANIPFIDKYGAKRYQNHVAMLGGITELARPDTNNCSNVYDVSMKQSVLQPAVGSLMLRHERRGDLRISSWKNCLVILRRYGKGSDEKNSSYSTQSHLGSLEVKGLRKGGLVILADRNNFCMDGATEMILDGKTFLRCNTNRVGIVHSQGRWYIRNDYPGALSVKITTFEPIGDNAVSIKSQTDKKLDVTGNAKDGYVASVKLGYEEALIIKK